MTPRSTHARDTLIERYEWLVPITVRRMRLPPHVEYDDAIGAGYIGLIRGVDTYDPGKGTKMETYLCNCVRYEVGHYTERSYPWGRMAYTRKWRVPAVCSLDRVDPGFEEPIGDLAPAPGLSVEETVLLRAFEEEAVGVVDRLPPMARSAALRVLWDEMSGTEYGHVSGKGPTAVGSRVRLARVRLREALAEWR